MSALNDAVEICREEMQKKGLRLARGSHMECRWVWADAAPGAANLLEPAE